MISSKDEKESVKEIQRFLLYYYNFEDKNIGRVAVDGIYGVETQNAVLEYQKIKKIDATGLVDLLTHQSLYKEYLRLSKNLDADELIIEPNNFPLSVGKSGYDIMQLNLLLDILRQTYKDIERVKKDSYFSKNTESAVKDMQRIFMMEENGVVDTLLFMRIMQETKASKLSDEKYI